MDTSKLKNRTLIEGAFFIKSKRGTKMPFLLNVAQRYYWTNRRRRNIILKPRQKGLTKIIDADQLMDCMKKPTNAVVVSHEQESTKRLFQGVKYYLDNMTLKPVISIDNANTIQFPKVGSNYFIGTAGQRAFGRGDTIDRAHLSEAAFYHDLKTILAGISEAAEYGQIDIETTPNGRGNDFYDMYLAAKEGRSPYIAIFIPWFIDDEYSADNLTVEERAGLSPAVQEMFDIPDAELVYTDEEKELIAKGLREYQVLITPGMIKWRRYKIWDKGDLFFQEYPEDDVTCFLQSGRPVFKSITMRHEYKIDLEAVKSDVQTAEIKKRKLFGGVDGAEGTKGGDNHCFAVIDATEHPARTIFQIKTNEPSEVFDLRVHNLCKKFGIRLMVEKNGVGVAHTKEFRRLGTIFKEWNTTGTTRPVMLLDLERAYRTGEMVESYEDAKNEALDMYYDKSNTPVHPQGKHDDTVFARAVALQLSKMPTPGIL